MKKKESLINNIARHEEEIVNSQDYYSNLDQLLNKISIQNRYSNRITTCNIRNIHQLKSTKQQLNKLKEDIRIQKQCGEGLQQVIDRLKRQIKHLREDLAVTAMELIKAKKTVKKLKVYLGQLQNKTVELSLDNLTERKIKTEQISFLNEKYHSQLLQSMVKDFLIEIPFDDSNLLVRHCRQCVIQNKFQHFFMRLNTKFDEEKTKNQKELTTKICPRFLNLSREIKSTINQGSSLKKHRQHQETFTQQFSRRRIFTHRTRTMGSVSTPKKIIL